MNGTEQKLKREHFKKSYEFICCKCGYKQHAKPSIMMVGFGINSGQGSCIKCKEFLHLEIEKGLDGEIMISVFWNDFLKQKNEIKKS